MSPSELMQNYLILKIKDFLDDDHKHLFAAYVSKLFEGIPLDVHLQYP